MSDKIMALERTCTDCVDTISDRIEYRRKAETAYSVEYHRRLLTISVWNTIGDCLPSQCGIPPETAYHLSVEYHRRLLTISVWNTIGDCLPSQCGIPSETAYHLSVEYHRRLLTISVWNTIGDCLPSQCGIPSETAYHRKPLTISERNTTGLLII